MNKEEKKKYKIRMPSFKDFPSLPARLSLRDQALFAKRLSLLIKANVPIVNSINILKRQSKGGNQKMFERVASDVSNGQFLSKSLFNFKGVFGDFAINIIKVGESSGTLSENLKYLSEELDKKRELRGKVVGALVYPAVIMLASLGISLLLVLFLFPKLLPVFQSLHVTLPLSTRILLAISTFLTNYGFWVMGGSVLAVIGFIISLRFEPVRYAFDAFLLKIPVIGKLFKNYHLTNMCRTLGLLLKGQLTAVEAAIVTSDTSTNLVYKKELVNLRQAIMRGAGIARHLEKKPKLFPVMMTEMIAIGEATGNLSETLLYLAQMCEQDLDEATKRLSSVIEPAMMIVMGLLVGFIAVSIITPIYEVTQHLNP